MELQFKIRCKISEEYLLGQLGKENIGSIVHNEKGGVTVSKEITNNNIKALLNISALNVAGYCASTDRLDITNIFTRYDNMLSFDVDLKESFLYHDPNVLKNIIVAYSGIVKEMNVISEEPLDDCGTITFNLSPLQNNFRDIVFLLDSAFCFSIKYGAPYESAARHALNYITITAYPRKNYFERILLNLAKMLNAKISKLSTIKTSELNNEIP